MKYCGPRCQAGADARRKRERRHMLRAMAVLAPCRFNSGVDCTDCSGCSSCGWNPEVAERRTRALAK